MIFYKNFFVIGIFLTMWPGGEIICLKEIEFSK